MRVTMHLTPPLPAVPPHEIEINDGKRPKQHPSWMPRPTHTPAYLRTSEDSQRLKEAFGDGVRIAIIGAGWIGLEVAAAARGAGCEVTVLESLDLPLLRCSAPRSPRPSRTCTASTASTC